VSNNSDFRPLVRRLADLRRATAQRLKRGDTEQQVRDVLRAHGWSERHGHRIVSTCRPLIPYVNLAEPQPEDFTYSSEAASALSDPYSGPDSMVVFALGKMRPPPPQTAPIASLPDTRQQPRWWTRKAAQFVARRRANPPTSLLFVLELILSPDRAEFVVGDVEAKYRSRIQPTYGTFRAHVWLVMVVIYEFLYQSWVSPLIRRMVRWAIGGGFLMAVVRWFS
jgi:hypothetical protein